MNQKEWDVDFVPKICASYPGDEKYAKWVSSKASICEDMMFDAYLWRVCYNIWKKLAGAKKDNDHFTVICGLERSGKSTLLKKMNSIISSDSFSQKYIIYTTDDFIPPLEEIRDKELKCASLQLDEGAMMLFSRESMTKKNRLVVQFFNICGQMNMHVGICIPSIRNLDTYIREHRMETFIQIMGKDSYKYRGYTEEGIRMFNNPKNKGKVSDELTWKGWWTKSNPILRDLKEADYRDKKRNHLDLFINGMKKTKGGIPGEKPPVTPEVISELRKLGIKWKDLANIYQRDDKVLRVLASKSCYSLVKGGG